MSETTEQRSVDFSRQRPLQWDAIEVQLHLLSQRAIMVEMVGRTAVDSVHSEKLTEMFDRLREDIDGHIDMLKDLLGLVKGAQQ